MVSAEIRPNQSKEQLREEALNRLNDLLYNYSDEIPEGRISSANTDNLKYKCRTNFFISVRYLVNTWQQDKLFQANATNELIEGFNVYCGSGRFSRGGIDVTRGEIKNLNLFFKCLIRDLHGKKNKTTHIEWLDSKMKNKILLSEAMHQASALARSRTGAMVQ